MKRLLLLLGIAAALVGVAAGCGDSGPTGPNAKAVEEFEDLGLSQKKAEAEVRAANREAAKQVKREEPQIPREVREEEARRAEPKKKRRKTLAQAAGFYGKYEESFELGRFACSNYPLERIAREFHLPPSANEFEVAEAYADGYYGRFEQGALEGCFEGIRQREPR